MRCYMKHEEGSKWRRMCIKKLKKWKKHMMNKCITCVQSYKPTSKYISLHKSRQQSNKRQVVQPTSSHTPPVKAKIQRIADREGLSISQTVRAVLEEWVRQKLHIQHAVLLQPII